MRRRAAYLLTAAFVLAYAAARWSAIPYVVDDDFMYLELAQQPASTGDYAPLYVAWYRLILRLTGDPATALRANVTILTVATAVLLWLVLRKIGARWGAALLCVAGLPLLMLVDTRPWVSLFATAIALAGLALPWSWAPAAVLGVCTFVRPEMLLAFVLALVVLRRGKAVACIPAVGLMLIFGLPLSGERAELAFSQHYALNVERVEKIGIDGFNEWAPVMERDFGGRVSFQRAMRVNPQRALWHVGVNVRTLWQPAALLAFAGELPFSVRVVMALPLIFLVALGTAVYASRWRTLDAAQQTVLRVFTFVTIPALISGVLVYPRQHYFTTTAALALVIGCWGVDRLVGPRRNSETGSPRSSAIRAAA